MTDAPTSSGDTPVLAIDPSRALAGVIAAAVSSFPVVHLHEDALDAVVTGCLGSVATLLIDGRTERQVHLSQHASAITDPDRQMTLLRRAMATLTDTARNNVADHRRSHQRNLREIRDYAVARHQDGDICRDGLNKFLAHFDLDAYEPTIRVRYTITGSYLVRGTESDAEHDGRSYLRPDLSRVDDVVDDSDEFSVAIDSADELPDD